MTYDWRCPFAKFLLERDTEAGYIEASMDDGWNSDDNWDLAVEKHWLSRLLSGVKRNVNKA